MSTVVKDTHHDEHPSGIMRWLTTTNHKDIGSLYLWFALIMFFIGGLMALVIRSELFQPGLQFVDPQFFNSMTTMHALVMIFGVVMPAFTGLANWMIPIMIGGPDMALPRMNNYSFWIMPFAFSMLLSTLLAYGSLNDNSEIKALKSIGISIYRLILPGLILSIFNSVFS